LVVGWLVVTRVHCGQTVHPRPIVTIYIFIHHIMVAQQKKYIIKKLNNLTKVE